MEVGSLEIVGNIDVSSIKSGLSNVKRGLDEAKSSAKSAFGDMNRLGASVSGIAKPLALIGTAISGTFLGLTMMSPQMAPIMAKMKTDMFRLSVILGEKLAPTVEKVENSFSGLVDWLDAHPFAQDMVANLTKFAGALAVGGVVWKALTTFKSLILGLPKVIKIGISLYIAGFAGAHIGQWIGEQTKGFGQNIVGSLGEGVNEFLAYDVGGFLDTIFGTSITKGLPSREEFRKSMAISEKNEKEFNDLNYYKNTNLGD